MADVSVKYNGNVIAEMSESGQKTLLTSGKYCTKNIEINYNKSSAPAQEAQNVKVYNLTLSKASGWVLLTTLDAEVLEHINDASLVVSLANISPYVYEFYSGNLYIVGNKPFGYNGSYPVYGLSNRENSETSFVSNPIYYPANNTGNSDALGGMGVFRVADGKYYIKPRDGFITAGTYRLTFTW